MAKRETKADVILNAARLRVAHARTNRDALEVKTQVAQAVYDAEVSGLEVLEYQLKSEPRKSRPKSTTVVGAGKKSSRKSSETSSAPNILGEMESALRVGGSGD